MILTLWERDWSKCHVSNMISWTLPPPFSTSHNILAPLKASCLLTNTKSLATVRARKREVAWIQLIPGPSPLPPPPPDTNLSTQAHDIDNYVAATWFTAYLPSMHAVISHLCYDFTKIKSKYHQWGRSKSEEIKSTMHCHVMNIMWFCMWPQTNHKL